LNGRLCCTAFVRITGSKKAPMNKECERTSDIHKDAKHVVDVISLLNISICFYLRSAEGRLNGRNLSNPGPSTQAIHITCCNLLMLFVVTYSYIHINIYIYIYCIYTYIYIYKHTEKKRERERQRYIGSQNSPVLLAIKSCRTCTTC
jgi:hypothetical protein